MRRTHSFLKIHFLCAFLLITNLSHAQQADSVKKLPPAQWLRTQKIDVKHITLDLRFDWQKKQAFGSATLTLTPLSKTDKIALDAAKMTINSVFLNNKPLKYDYDGGEKDENLNIYLDHAYTANEVITIKIDYKTNWVNEPDPNTLGGSNGKGLRFFQPSTTEPRKRKQLWSMAEYDCNRYWFPCHDVGNDFRTSELKATVEKPLMGISNGNLIEKKTTRTVHALFIGKWISLTPIIKPQLLLANTLRLRTKRNRNPKSEAQNRKILRGGFSATPTPMNWKQPKHQQLNCLK